MKAKWPSALGSLDQHLDALDEVAQQLESAHPVNVASATEELKAVEESVRNLRAMLLAEVPDADWNTREELNTLVHARHVEQQRSRLVALAAELERGQISHRRAARVTQLNELREEAVKELRYLSGIEAEPPALPGPEAGDWVQWACSLKEPEDTDSLQALRKGFAYLDEFVASLEPGMWQVEGAPPQLDVALGAEDIQLRRSRLVEMAAELERGNIVHHRALRVTQMTQLRDEAVKELRALAAVHGIPPDLPGPEPVQWVQWACGLKEPDDADALQKLRARFDHLDEFVAGLEPEMWVQGPATAAVAAGAAAATTTTVPKPVAAAAAASAPSRARVRSPQPPPPAVPQKQATVEDTLLEASSVPTKPAEPPVETHVFREIVTTAEGEDTPDLKARLLTIWQEKRRMLVAVAAVLLVAILAAVLWRGHRTQASSLPAKPPDTKPAELAASTTVAPPTLVSTTTSPAADKTDKKDAKPKDDTATTPKAPAEKQAALLDNEGLRTPQAIPKNAVVARGEDASASSAGIAGAVPGGGSGNVPNGVMNIMKNVPVAQPKIRASSGVAEGELIHRVEPLYPAQARSAGVQGTVTLQALVAKDGRVRSVKVVKGPPLLSQAAADAVRQWRYKPFILNGEPTEADIQVNINFQQ